MKRRFFSLVVVLLAAAACDKPQFNPVGNWEVRFTIVLRAIDDDLLISPSAKIITKPRAKTDKLGLAGLILSRDVYGELHAFDLACPHEALRDVKVELDGVLVKCPKCGSIYDLSYGFGNRLSGPSVYDLKRYEVTPPDGMGSCRVYNPGYGY